MPLELWFVKFGSDFFIGTAWTVVPAAVAGRRLASSRLRSDSYFFMFFLLRRFDIFGLAQ